MGHIIKRLFSYKALLARLKEVRLSVHLLNKNKLTRVAFITIIILVAIAVIVPVAFPSLAHMASATDPQYKLLPPSWDHLFGTDDMGRDIFLRVLIGTQISLQTSLIAVGIALLIGVPLGAMAGYFGGFVDELIMRVTDIFLSFPSLLLAITIAAFLGPSLHNAIIAIAVSWWPWYTRLIRGQAVSIKERQFVKAAKSIGAPDYKIICQHIVPNCLGPVIVQASMDIGGVILTIASLSYLGLGAQPPQPEWGLMVSTSRNYFLDSWWYSIFPGMAIFITVLAFNLLGDGLREILDPKTRNK
ncbi:nickel transporter permease [Candidatus Formimonas warabiya]|uniref:nickel transporter permease n=1 Tax=Formimonas warabiya TaxID=1761012 RepID=UPI001F21A34D|nr:nickel transporter permease [Candidatus Formimonas warabiya]